MDENWDLTLLEAFHLFYVYLFWQSMVHIWLVQNLSLKLKLLTAGACHWHWYDFATIFHHVWFRFIVMLNLLSVYICQSSEIYICTVLYIIQWKIIWKLCLLCFTCELISLLFPSFSPDTVLFSLWTPANMPGLVEQSNSTAWEKETAWGEKRFAHVLSYTSLEWKRGLKWNYLIEK